MAKKQKTDIKEFVVDLNNFYTGPGVYFLYKDGVLVYIGKTKNVARRILNHLEAAEKEFDSVRYSKVPEDSLDIVESTLIKNLKPINNIMFNDGEHITPKRSCKRSRITIRPVARRATSLGEHPIAIRVVYQRRMFLIGTNLKGYPEDVKGSVIINKKLLADGIRVARPLYEAAKFISSDATYEYVRSKLKNVKI